MNLEKLKEDWKKEEEYLFTGWDFSHINNRMKEERLPWDYKKIVKSHMSEKKVLLDMGTGGGEFLLSLHPSPGKTYATEGYLPNLELSKKVLKPYGIEVRQVVDDGTLPFDNSYFDIIINKHESFCLSEVNRILKPGGVFITQQVGCENSREMSRFLLGQYPNIIDDDLNFNKILKEAKDSDLRVVTQGEYFPKTQFYDVGALVFFAKILPWEFPGFSVEKCFNRLVELQEKIEKEGYIEVIEHRYFIIAEKQGV